MQCVELLQPCTAIITADDVQLPVQSPSVMPSMQSRTRYGACLSACCLTCFLTFPASCNAQAANDAMREALKPEDLQQYAIMGQDSEFEQALPGGAVPASGIVNVKSREDKKALDKGKPQKEGKLYKRDGKNQQGRKNKAGGGKSTHNKKRRT